MKKKSLGITENPHIVREHYENGKLLWQIADDFVINDPEKVDQILKRIAENAQRALAAAEMKKQSR